MIWMGYEARRILVETPPGEGTFPVDGRIILKCILRK
jgi:hypothetical protein